MLTATTRIRFERALHFANQEGITEGLYPWFLDNIEQLLNPTRLAEPAPQQELSHEDAKRSRDVGDASSARDSRITMSNETPKL